MSTGGGGWPTRLGNGRLGQGEGFRKTWVSRPMAIHGTKPYSMLDDFSRDRGKRDGMLSYFRTFVLLVLVRSQSQHSVLLAYGGCNSLLHVIGCEEKKSLGNRGISLIRFVSSQVQDPLPWYRFGVRYSGQSAVWPHRRQIAYWRCKRGDVCNTSTRQMAVRKR